MPEYLSPGVYLEEVSFRAKSIEGVSTSTAAFIGPTRFGPTQGTPELVTSFADFERVFGGIDQLVWNDVAGHNYVAHAVRNFFEEGGKRLYVVRTFLEAEGSNGIATHEVESESVVDTGDNPIPVEFSARYPGSGGNVKVGLTLKVGRNALAAIPANPAELDGDLIPVLRGVSHRDVVWINDGDTLTGNNPAGKLYIAERSSTPTGYDWAFSAIEDANDRTLAELDLEGGNVVYPLSLVVAATFPSTLTRSGLGRTEVWEGLAFDPEHPRAFTKTFDPDATSRQIQLTVPLVVDVGSLAGHQILQVLFDADRDANDVSRLQTLLEGDALTAAELSIVNTIGCTRLSDADRTVAFFLEGGNDGVRPEASEYEGAETENPNEVAGLKALEDVPDVSILAAPGSTFDGASDSYKPDCDQIQRLLISHCERMRYRIAVLDAPNNQTIGEIRSYRAQLDSSHAALYYPWVKVQDPVTRTQILLPPSGFVSGIYARNDVEQGVHKAPANEVVRGAIGFEFLLNKSQQDVLNPEGINCFRYFEGRGYRLWGARTISSDPEWKYVNLRRYFAFLERSVERGTQWAVFENNGDELWAKVRRTIEDFLFNEWKSGHLLGLKPQEAYFVRCDRSTMTQNDLDNGRLICLIGACPIRPAEFVIFRIGQWTADTRS